MKKKLDSVFSIYSAGLVWVIYGLLLPIYRIIDILIAAAISFVVYLLVNKFLCEDKAESTGIAFKKTGSAEADDIIKQGQAFIMTLDRQNEKIPDTVLSRQIDSLKETSVGIFSFVGKNPEKARKLNTFMEYYFPTVIKLLDSYIELSAHTVGTENISDTIGKIEGVMESICAAFKKQLDVLYEDKNLDVKTDIDVLKTILSRENLD